ncbi:MAG TPA: hypothetical protein VIH89_08945 [Candidatus Sulfotelmatobacter sp.]
MSRKICFSVLAVACLMGLTNCTTGIPSVSVTSMVESIAATGGTPQSHAINAAFGAALVATVTTNGAPASGVLVTFTAPATGASATFSNTTFRTATGTTDANGLATSPALIANGIAGTYTVTATISGVSTTPATYNLTNTIGAPAAILATGGTPQGAAINATFAAPLVATVVDAGQNPVSGAIVTFTAPAMGASGTFADTSTNITTATTNASGVATSTLFTANGTSGADAVMATLPGVSTAATFNLTNMAGAPVAITATGGATQTAAINTAFSSPLVATVTDAASNPVSGVAVTFTAPGSATASGTFANATATETDTTDANGLATSTAFTANGMQGGPYTVTATTPGVSTPATFSLTNRVAANTYVFYLSRQEAFQPDFYALAGAVQIDPSGNVLAGEQDYNDAFGVTSPEPGGDAITGGALTVDSTTGQGTLTLNTNNTSLGVGGVETLGVQFANGNHALIIQFDGAATSSGSMDLQTLPGTLSGGYAFTLTGVDVFYSPVAYGGVFSTSDGTTLQNGLLDTNDDGAVTIGGTLTGTLSLPDSFGRGTITSNISYSGSIVNLNYYIVGLEAIRIIDVDSSDSAIGSAFGQGANATASTNGSLGSSVIGIQGSPFLVNFAALGMLSTSNTSSSSADFSGVADDDEYTYDLLFPGAPISGNYSIASNGYGSLTINPGDLGDVSALGIYMTDPNLNLNDPNNTTSGLGGALVADMDPILPGGTGVLIPQTDTAVASFTGNYAFGAQSFNDFLYEFDFVGQASFAGAVLSGTGILSDPFLTLASLATESVTVSGSPLPDPSNVGRYTMLATNPTPNPLNFTTDLATTGFNVVIYQASGGQLFWLDEDVLTVFLGSLQQQGSLTGLPAARKAAKKAKPKQ